MMSSRTGFAANGNPIVTVATASSPIPPEFRISVLAFRLLGCLHSRSRLGLRLRPNRVCRFGKRIRLGEGQVRRLNGSRRLFCSLRQTSSAFAQASSVVAAFVQASFAAFASAIAVFAALTLAAAWPALFAPAPASSIAFAHAASAFCPSLCLRRRRLRRLGHLFRCFLHRLCRLAPSRRPVLRLGLRLCLNPVWLAILSLLIAMLLVRCSENSPGGSCRRVACDLNARIPRPHANSVALRIEPPIASRNSHGA